MERFEAEGSPASWMSRAAYEVAGTPERALAWASSQVRARERGRNAGPEVDKYLAAAGLSPGYPWCAAFVTWCIKKIDKALMPRNGRAAVFSWAKWAEDNGRLSQEPKRGNLFFWLDRQGFGHIGFVTSVLPGGVFLTIEGNTDEAGSREGVKVARRMRTMAGLKRNHRHGFINLGEKA